MDVESNCKKAFEKCKVVLLDVAGTTTSIAFVKETLFPYATDNVESFLKENWDVEDIKIALKLLNEDKDVPEIDVAIHLIKDAIKKQSDNATLKTINGLLFKKGYEDGTLKAHVFPDVPAALATWSKDHKVAIYSTGSVESQKLLFKHTIEGDLSSDISHYFDQSVGIKTEKNSYLNIVKELDVPADKIMFISDETAELKAAKEAGLNTIFISREGNEVTNDFMKITSFTEVIESCNKRKNEENGSEGEPPSKLHKKEGAAEIKISEEMEPMEVESSETISEPVTDATCTIGTDVTNTTETDILEESAENLSNIDTKTAKTALLNDSAERTLSTDVTQTTLPISVSNDSSESTDITKATDAAVVKECASNVATKTMEASTKDSVENPLSTEVTKVPEGGISKDSVESLHTTGSKMSETAILKTSVKSTVSTDVTSTTDSGISKNSIESPLSTEVTKTMWSDIDSVESPLTNNCTKMMEANILKDFVESTTLGTDDDKMTETVVLKDSTEGTLKSDTTKTMETDILQSSAGVLTATEAMENDILANSTEIKTDASIATSETPMELGSSLESGTATDKTEIVKPIVETNIQAGMKQQVVKEDIKVEEKSIHNAVKEAQVSDAAPEKIEEVTNNAIMVECEKQEEDIKKKMELESDIEIKENSIIETNEKSEIVLIENGEMTNKSKLTEAVNKDETKPLEVELNIEGAINNAASKVKGPVCDSTEESESFQKEHCNEKSASNDHSLMESDVIIDKVTIKTNKEVPEIVITDGSVNKSDTEVATELKTEIFEKLNNVESVTLPITENKAVKPDKSPDNNTEVSSTVDNIPNGKELNGKTNGTEVKIKKLDANAESAPVSIEA